MNLSLAININRAALLRIVAMLFAASGLGAGKPNMLSRIIRNSVLEQLRTAESAGRRLFAALAQELAAQGVALKPRRKGAAPTQPIPNGTGTRVPPFALFDPRKRFAQNKSRRYAKGTGPRLTLLDGSDQQARPVPEDKKAASPDEKTDAGGLCRRLQALQNALESPLKQARRLLRDQARRAHRQSGLCGPEPPPVTGIASVTRSMIFCASVI